MIRSILFTAIFIIWTNVYGQNDDAMVFQIDELILQANEDNKRYLRFLDNGTLSSGIYQLGVEDTDEQRPHEWDEIYYVLEGSAKLKVEDELFEVKPGGILFVAAEKDHQFVNIREKLKLLVFFSKAKP